MRINRYIARSGVTSRRKAEALIKSGVVSVNGAVVTELATEVNELMDTVSVSGKIISLPNFKYFMLNKPVGYTTSKSDPHADKTVFELLPADNSLVTAGRLDRETSGLLLITNNGDFVQRIIHPSNKIEKEYLVTTKDELPPDKVKELAEGVMIDGRITKAVKAERAKEKNSLTLVIEEGRKRIVRRMIKAVSGEVTALTRLRIGEIYLDTKPGEYRALTEKEVAPYVK